jgi:hypothetical protein
MVLTFLTYNIELYNGTPKRNKETGIRYIARCSGTLTSTYRTKFFVINVNKEIYSYTAVGECLRVKVVYTKSKSGRYVRNIWHVWIKWWRIG